MSDKKQGKSTPGSKSMPKTLSTKKRNGMNHKKSEEDEIQSVMNDLGILTDSNDSTSGLTDQLSSQNSQNLVNPSVNPSVNYSVPSDQLTPTRLNYDTTKNQQNNYLSELGRQAKGDLEVLVATGKTKDFLGKILTFQDLDYMPEKELQKNHRIYQQALAVRVNDTFGKIAVRAYSKVASWVLPINDEDKLYSDLRNDYILMNELDKWTGWLSLKMGGLMALASTSLITFTNINGGNRNSETRYPECSRDECSRDTQFIPEDRSGPYTPNSNSETRYSTDTS